MMVRVASENKPALFAGVGLVLAVLQGQAPRLVEGWQEAQPKWLSERMAASFAAYQHDNPEVVRVVQRITFELAGGELVPGVDVRYLYVPTA